jgi:hypothetical protein
VRNAAGLDADVDPAVEVVGQERADDVFPPGISAGGSPAAGGGLETRNPAGAGSRRPCPLRAASPDRSGIPPGYGFGLGSGSGARALDAGENYNRSMPAMSMTERRDVVRKAARARWRSPRKARAS